MNEEPKNCIIDCRVSTTKQLEGDSLENQELVARELAERNGWNVVRAFAKQYSSSQSVRSDFDEIVAFIKSGDIPIHYYIFKSIDRFTRSDVEPYLNMTATLKALGVNVIDTYGIIQPEQNTLEHLGFSYDWSTYSPTEAAQILEAHRSKQEVRDILTRMIGAEISLVQDGYKVRQPNDGFVNKRIYVDGKKRMIQEPDPKRADFFIEMFKLRATGSLSDVQIVTRMNALGYRSRPQKRWDKQRNAVIGRRDGKPLTIKQLHRFIQRPIYAGVLCEKWTSYRPIRARYDGLVSIDTYNKANRGKVSIQEEPDGTLKLHYGVSPDGKIRISRLKNNALYPYKAIILCPDCAKPFMDSASTGKLGTKYPAYHCSRNGHYLRIPKTAFDETVDGYLADIALKPWFLEELERRLIAKYEQRSDDIRKEAKRVRVNLAALEAEQADAVESLIATKSLVARSKTEERIEQLENRIAQASAHKQDPSISRTDIHAFIAFAKKYMEHPKKLLKNNANMQGQATVAGLIFEKPPSYDEIANGTPKLSPVFALSQAFDGAKSPCVTQLSPDWNTWASIIQEWNRVFKLRDMDGKHNIASCP